MTTASTLRDDAIAIWRAGVAAVDARRLVRAQVAIVEGRLHVAGESASLAEIGRIVVLGGGKAGAAMAAAVEEVFVGAGEPARLEGWVNVSADCVRELERITLHAARPAGVNEPTAEGVAGTERILELAASLGPRDVAIVLLSGGGSALLPAPVEGVSLADKQAITRLLMRSGATIGELNAVRRPLSRIKGGGLARQLAGAKRVWTLIVSDVVGDPLDVIASGPTIEDPASAAEALATLERLVPDRKEIPAAVRRKLVEERAATSDDEPFPANIVDRVIGNNVVAMTGAASEARRRGYVVRDLGSDNTGVARDVGAFLALECRRIRDEERPDAPICLLSGGEPIVRLATTDQPRKGGRNQEVAVAAVAALFDDGGHGVAVLSGGTDGEDGPTDAAGGIADADVIAAAHARNLFPESFLAINDAYHFLEPTGGLLVTGPTHTNVMDLRVALVERVDGR